MENPKQLIARLKANDYSVMGVMKIPYKYDDEGSRAHAIDKFLARIKPGNTANLFIEFPDGDSRAGQVIRRLRFGTNVPANAKQQFRKSVLKLVIYMAETGEKQTFYSNTTTDRTNPDGAAWELWNTHKANRKNYRSATIYLVDEDRRFFNKAGEDMHWVYGERKKTSITTSNTTTNDNSHDSSIHLLCPLPRTQNGTPLRNTKLLHCLNKKRHTEARKLHSSNRKPSKVIQIRSGQCINHWRFFLTTKAA